MEPTAIINDLFLKTLQHFDSNNSEREYKQLQHEIKKSESAKENRRLLEAWSGVKQIDWNKI
jgi:hypothetical protein